MKMTDRERLIDLIEEFGDDIAFCDICKSPDSDCDGCRNERFADYLIEHGVIVLPCKVGDTVYIINRANKPQEMIFDLIYMRCICVNDTDCMCGSLCNIKEHNLCQYRFKNDFSDFGKTVFLTHEEAEKALKERESNV